MSDITLDSLLDSLSDHNAEPEIEKAASETEVSVADQLKNTLTKEASDASQIGENNMSVETGSTIANSILAMLDGGMNKAASEAGEPTQGNNVKEELDQMEAQHAERILETPRQGKTVTEVAKALQARAPAGSGCDEVDGSKEGNSEAATPAIPSDIEKAAAIRELANEGYSMDEAFEMVKAASVQMEREAHEFEKVAAVDALIAEGIDFESAVAMVKQASDEVNGEEYTDLEKSAAIADLVAEDGLSFDEAYALVKEAALTGKQVPLVDLPV